MVFIDLSTHTIPQEWITKAQQLTDELVAAPTEAARKKIIDDNQEFWSTAKKHLPYAEKCWFSEAKEAVSPYEVEHFRPKNAVSKYTSVTKVQKNILGDVEKENFKQNIIDNIEAQRNDWTKERKYKGVGYWWLAFNYRNYRVVGKLINTKKSTRFPLKIGSPIGYNVDFDINTERVVLLDPTNEADTKLLTFNSDGSVSPSYTNSAEYQYLRALVSIDIYGLNKLPNLTEGRKNKWKQCVNLIDNNQVFYPQIQHLLNSENAEINDSTANALAQFDRNNDALRDLLDKNAAYTAVILTCLKSYNDEWIREYILMS
jgi:hypothetical protein